MQVLVWFDCDEWKSYSSCRLIGVCDKKQRNKFYDMIKESHNYNDEDMELYICVEERELNEEA